MSDLFKETKHALRDETLLEAKPGPVLLIPEGLLSAFCEDPRCHSFLQCFCTLCLPTIGPYADLSKHVKEASWLCCAGVTKPSDHSHLSPLIQHEDNKLALAMTALLILWSGTDFTVQAIVYNYLDQIVKFRGWHFKEEAHRKESGFVNMTQKMLYWENQEKKWHFLLFRWLLDAWVLVGERTPLLLANGNMPLPLPEFYFSYLHD